MTRVITQKTKRRTTSLKMGGTQQQKHEMKLKTQEYLLKGYPPMRILEIFNQERKAKGQGLMSKNTVYEYIRELEDEHSAWYLNMLKDQTAFIILHRQKLLALDLYKKMLHDKIIFAGGIKDIKPDQLNRIIATLHDLTISQSKLEKEIPYLFGLTKNKSAEELAQIESSILQGLPEPLQNEYFKRTEEKAKRELGIQKTIKDHTALLYPELESTASSSPLSRDFNDRTINEYVTNIEQTVIPEDMEAIQREVENEKMGAHTQDPFIKKELPPEK